MSSTLEDAGKSTKFERVDVKAVNSKEERSLYQARIKIFPKRVAGTFRSLKWWVMIVTLGIYYITPWIRWDRGPHAPDQAVLVDMANARFYFFFIEIWPQELIFVAGLLIMAGVGLFLITSSIGRAWCGYTCPQTVWVDLFLVVERWLEGDRNARIKLDKGPWNFDKFRKRILKHGIWLLIAMATGGAWIFYFADAPTLARDFFTFQAHPVAYTTVGILTATTYVFAGFMREQVCTYMCPWPRIQAAMLDEHSLVVTYNDWRGEPRSRHQKKNQPEDNPFGDCVDCNQCVAVCPMGIDIRDGQQLECITCALCIDACDGVMEKVGKPRGLISYSTLDTYNEAKQGNAQPTSWQSFIRPRTFLYFGVWGLIGLIILYGLLVRDRLDLNVLHDRNPLFVQLSDGSIRNGYTIKVLNMITQPRDFILRTEGLEGASMTMLGSNLGPSDQVAISVDANTLKKVKIFVKVNGENISGSSMEFRFVVEDVNKTESISTETVFRSAN